MYYTWVLSHRWFEYERGDVFLPGVDKVVPGGDRQAGQGKLCCCIGQFDFLHQARPFAVVLSLTHIQLLRNILSLCALAHPYPLVCGIVQLGCSHPSTPYTTSCGCGTPHRVWVFIAERVNNHIPIGIWCSGGI